MCYNIMTNSMKGGEAVIEKRFPDAKKQKLTAVFIISLMLSVLLGAGTVLLSGVALLLLPFLAGTLAVLYTFDKSKRPWVSLLISFATVFFDLILTPRGSVWGAAAVLLATFITAWFLRNAGKAFFVGLSAVTLSFLMLLSVYLAAFSTVGFDFNAANELLSVEADNLRYSLEEGLDMLLSVAADEEQIAALLSEGYVRSSVDLYMSMLPSVVVILALAVTALANGVYLIAIRAASKKASLGTDMFCTSATFAVFFVILAIFNLFESDGSVFNTAMLNLYNVFLVVFAYVGFRFASYMLSQRIKSLALSVIILLVVCFIFSAFSVNLLSVVGVLETFAVSKMFREKQEKKGGGNGYE